MRLSRVIRGLTFAALALMIGYAYLLEVQAPHWPVWPHSWRTVAEFGLLVCALVALVSAGLAGHLDRR